MKKTAARIAGAALALALAAAGTPGIAQTQFPVKPIRLIIGSAPGSGPDVISRTLSERMAEVWGQRIVVDARPGAAGAISADLALQTNPDGYTWMMLTSQLFAATQVLTGLKFDLARDFQSVALIGATPFIMLANTTQPARNLRELIDLARKSPGTIRYGSAGTGASEHLSGVLFNHLTSTSMLHVPYKGVPQAITDTLSNEVQFTFAVLPVALPHIQSGRLIALGGTIPRRFPQIPDVPAISEVVPGYAMYAWYSIVAPTGTPNAILDKASTDLVRVLREPAMGERLRNMGIDVMAGDRKALDQWRAEENKRISMTVKLSGATR